MYHLMCALQIVWNVDVCAVPLHVHFKWGVTLVEEFNHWALLTLSRENISGTRALLRRRAAEWRARNGVQQRCASATASDSARDSGQQRGARAMARDDAQRRDTHDSEP